MRHVPSLSVPESEDALGVSESGRLFIARARAVRPHFAISKDNAVDILSICRQLEGIPLAIELAAARIRVLSPQRIAAGLTRNLGLLDLSESSGASQRTLQASVAWSHTLCSETQQILFRRLAVFVSGFTLEAAEAVCDGAPLNSFAILDLLDQLIDQSIVAVDDARPERRFNLLETIRAFAMDRLDESGEGDSVRDRHLMYFCQLANSADGGIFGPSGLTWLPRLEDEYPNFLAALEWARSRGQTEALLRLATSLALFWEMRGRFMDGSIWLDHALELGVQGIVEPDALLIRALWARAHLAIYAADFGTALAIAPAAVTMADRIGDRKAAGRLRNTYGIGLCYSDPDAAVSVLTASIAIGYSEGDDWTVADSTKFLTVAYLISGDLQRCEAGALELRKVATRLDNAFFLGWCDGAKGYCQLMRGQICEGIASFERSVTAAAEVGDPPTLGIVQAWRAYALAKLGRYAESRAAATDCLTNVIRQGGTIASPFARIALGVADLAEGNYETAAAKLGEVARWSREKGDTFSALWAVPLYGQALVAAGALQEAKTVLDEGVRLAAPPIGNPWSTAQAIYGQAMLAEAGGHVVEAEQLMHAALSIQQQHGLCADVLSSLHALAILAAKASSWHEAVRLFGAADALAAKEGLVWSCWQTAKRAEWEPECRAKLGEAVFASARADGAGLTVAEAVAYAARSRGSRGRPTCGWESLSATERRVVDCVAQGLTNPQIAQRLLMSRATVKTHLAHAFDKLEVGTRAELAAAATRRAITSPNLADSTCRRLATHASTVRKDGRSGAGGLPSTYHEHRGQSNSVIAPRVPTDRKLGGRVLDSAKSIVQDTPGLAALLENQRLAVVLAEARTGQIAMWNAGAEHMWGYASNEVIGRDVAVLVPERLRDRHRAGLARYGATGTFSKPDRHKANYIPVRHRSGREMVARGTLRALGLPSDPYALVTLDLWFDVPERSTG